MSRDKILTKLATDVAPSAWPDGESHFFYEGEILGWNEYQLRRTELINRPSWDDAPEWAQWVAQDGGGEWCFYPEKPEQSGTMWINDEPKNGIWVDVHCTGRLPAGHDWRDTLEQRPQPQSDIKTCLHCGKDFLRPHLDSIPDDRCTRCDDEIKALWPEREPVKTWWTSKTCTQCGHTTAAKVSDDKPVCPGCVAIGPDVSDGGPDISYLHYAEDSDEESALSQAMEEQMRAASEKWARGDMEASTKQHRYRDTKGDDWIDEFARTATPEEFRGAMRFTVGKYNRRIGKKDAELSEVRKMRDYCDRWEAYLKAQGGEE